jgi:RNA polymerase sigma-70 factor (sigma-E family)
MGRPDEDFEHFVRENTPRLLRTAYLVTWDLAEAEDCVQDALTVTLRHWRRVKSMESPRAYVRTIVLRRAIRQSQTRARRRTEPLSSDYVDERFAKECDALDTRSEILWLLQGLPRGQRAVLALRYYDDLSELEIAEQLGWPVGTVKSTAARALERLREAIGDLDAGITRAPRATLTNKENP